MWLKSKSFIQSSCPPPRQIRVRGLHTASLSSCTCNSQFSTIVFSSPYSLYTHALGIHAALSCFICVQGELCQTSAKRNLNFSLKSKNYFIMQGNIVASCKHVTNVENKLIAIERLFRILVYLCLQKLWFSLSPFLTFLTVYNYM